MKSTLDYANHEGCEDIVTYFVLDTSRTEPATRRVEIMMFLAQARESNTRSPEMTELRNELYWLANELADADKLVNQYLTFLRESYPQEFCTNIALEFFLDRVEQEPPLQKIELLGNVGALMHFNEEDHKRWTVAYDEARQFERRFETLLAKIRGGHFRGLNREAEARFCAKEATRAPSPAAAS